jgi:DNA-binding PadR family transcriptional regulator
MPDLRLSPISYVVLGIVDALGEATPYDLKRAAAAGVGYFWSLPHTQLYSEPARLAEAGLLDERRERTGRRRRIYSLTLAGRDQLERWRREPTSELYEIRDAGLLQLFLGADRARLAEAQLAAHRGNLAELERIQAESREADVSDGSRLALEAGIGHAREYVRFWTRVLKDAS